MLASSEGSSQPSVCFTKYEVVDHILPTAVCKPVTVGSNAVLTADVIDGGSFDNCGIKNRLINVTSTGPCDSSFPISLTVTDYSGNVAKCETIVTVVDSVAPEAKCKNATQNVGITGSATVTQSQGSLVDNGSVDVCDGTDLTLQLLFNGTAASITRDCSTLGTAIVGLEAIDTHGNVGSCKANVFFVDETNPVAVCIDLTIDVGVTGEYNLTAQSVTGGSTDTCGISSYGNDLLFTCYDLREYDYWNYWWRQFVGYEIQTFAETFYVTDNSFNQDSCVSMITVVDDTPPVAECLATLTIEVGYDYANIYYYYLDNGSFDICSGITYQLSQDTFSCADIGTKNITLTVFDAFLNQASCQTPVTFKDTVPPNAYCQSNIIDVGATPSGSYTVHPSDTFLIDNGSNDACTNVTSSLNIARDLDITCNLLGTRSFTLAVDDAYGNTGYCSADVYFVDYTKPTLVCSATEELDIGDGQNHYLTSAFLMDGTTDVCGVTYSPVEHVFNCSMGLGAKSVISTATDPSSNSQNCNTIVTVSDLLEPVPECKLTASLNVGATGTVIAVPNDIDAGSYDACTAISTSIINSQTTFTCADIDVHDVILQVSDVSGNIATCTAPLHIVDTTAPTAVCKTYIVDVGAAPGGFVSLNVNDGYLANGGSSDVCTASTDLVYTFNTPVTGTCGTLGSRYPKLFVADQYGNQASCTANITFVDLTPPEVACATTHTINVGRGAVTPVLSEIATASDICGPLFYSTTDPTSYNCTQIGDHSFTITVTDGAGNIGTCTTTLRVLDTTPPKANCTTFTLPVGTGFGILAPTDVNFGSVDKCDAAPVLSLDKSNFTCADVGTRVVTLTVKDISNNTDTCQSPVKIVDTTAPVAICKNITVDVGVDGSVTLPTTSGSLVDNGSNDICSPVALSLNQTYTGTCATIGDQIATLNVTDDSGNLSSCTSTIAFRDLTPPTIVCRAQVTVDVGSNAYTFNPTLGVLTYFDTCDGPATTFTANQTAFTCTAIGSQSVNITVTDPSGNEAFCSTTLIGEDHVGPNALCLSNVVVQVGSGSGTITVASIDGGSADACLGALTSSINQTLFTCAQAGLTVPVELSLLDQYGNPSSCIGTVTPRDIVAPVALCRDVDVYLDATGAATITPSYVDNGSADTCTPVTLALSKTTFACGDVGPAVSVVLTVTDAFANVATCTSKVTVKDTVLPIAKCVNVITSAPFTSVATGAVNAGSSDACGVALSLSTATFTNSIGGVTTLYVTDPSGNTDTCTSQVTVQFGLALTVQAGQPLATVGGFAEHIPFVISWAADITVPSGTLVTLALLNSENSFYYVIAENVQFSRLKYVVQDGITDVTPDQDYLIVMYVPGKTNYASKAITLIRYPTNHP